ncbi:MAG TPA: fumarylacetoacetate hydrolase family protein [Bacteroidia bacterium]|jgi:acylpyruvate hydrolase|nr:fumarylacetoacetate hydrolase family protein [Bacteroidia bacterium]
MKIICIGRNYAEHAKEMKSELPAEPVFFMKPETALLKGNDFYYPDFTKDLHHEVEIVLKISKNGKHIAEEFAANYYNEIGVGIDFTARDLQMKCKEKGLPWEKAKAFDNSAPVSEFIAKEKFSSLANLNFGLKINGMQRQKGNTKDLIFSFEKVIVYISKFVTLKTGDLIFTGTPEGVSAVHTGDVLEASIENQKLLILNIK